MKYRDFLAVINSDKSNAFNEFIDKEDPNTIDEGGQTILMNCIVSHRKDLVEILLNKDININAKTPIGYTALHFAVQEGQFEILKLLLNNENIKVDEKDNWGNTPLWRAVLKNPVDTKIILELLKHKADPKQENNFGISAYKNIKDFFEQGQNEFKDVIEYIDK